MLSKSWNTRPLTYRQQAVKAFYSEDAQVKQERSDYYRSLIRKVAEQRKPNA